MRGEELRERIDAVLDAGDYDANGKWMSVDAASVAAAIVEALGITREDVEALRSVRWLTDDEITPDRDCSRIADALTTLLDAAEEDQ